LGAEENMSVTGSSSGHPQFIASTGNRSLSNAPLIENPDSDQIVVPDVSFNGPSILTGQLCIMFLVALWI